MDVLIAWLITQAGVRQVLLFRILTSCVKILLTPLELQLLPLSFHCPFMTVWLFYMLVHVDPPHQPIDDFSSEDLRNLFDLNVMGYFLMSKVCLSVFKPILCHDSLASFFDNGIRSLCAVGLLRERKIARKVSIYRTKFLHNGLTEKLFLIKRHQNIQTQWHCTISLYTPTCA